MYTIREATSADFKALDALFAEVDGFHRRELPEVFRKPQGPARSSAYLKGIIGDPDSVLFVADTGEQLVGLIVVLIHDAHPIPLLRPRRFAAVDNLAVTGAFQRHGVGRALMRRAQEWAVEQGAETMQLTVWEFNDRARAFYESLGYTTAHRMMWKKLSSAPR